MVAKVIQIGQYQKESPDNTSGVFRKPGSKKLYVDFYSNGVRIQKSSGLNDTSENWRTLQTWVNKQKDKVEAGTFKFAEAFPNASEKEKALHARLEGAEYTTNTDEIQFNDYLDQWVKNNLPEFPPGKRRDYMISIDSRIRPFFKGKTFKEITGVTIKEFIRQLKHKSGPQAGQLLSASRTKNILIPLRAIWYDAVEEYQWERSDPFVFTQRFFTQDLETRPQKAQPQVFRFDEWELILENMHPHFRPMIEVMIRTGLIASEIAGLKKSAVKKDHILIENSIVQNHEKMQLKTKYRNRKIPLTQKVKEQINLAMLQTDSDYVFRNTIGNFTEPKAFAKGVWKSALKKAKVPYRVPYTMRHSFAAWSLALDMHPNRLVKLMGHGSKKMVYEVYGTYVDDLERDVGRIREYYGFDFK